MGKSGGGIEEGVKGQSQGQRSGSDKGRDKGPEPGPGGIDRMCAVRFPLHQWLEVDVEVEGEGKKGSIHGGALSRKKGREKQKHKRYTKYVNKPKQAEQT